MRIGIEEKKILYAFGCKNYESTLRRLKLVCALAVDAGLKRRALFLGKKMEEAGMEEEYSFFYKQLRMEMERYFKAERYLETVENGGDAACCWEKIGLW